MKSSRRIKVVLLGMLVCTGLLGTAYGALYGWIQWDAHRKAQEVMDDYPQAADAVEALVLRMRDENYRMKDRDMAVWALGRLADERALTALEQEYTGKPCKHDTFLCQYELEKAIRRCSGMIDKSKQIQQP